MSAIKKGLFTAARHACLLLAALISFYGAAQAAEPSNKGRAFYVAFPGNYSGTLWGDKDIYMTSDVTATATIYDAGLYKGHFDIYPGQTTIYNVYFSSELQPDESLEYKAIKITSTADISVYGMYKDTVRSDAFTVYPVSSLSTEYVVSTYQSSNAELASGNSRFAVIGTQNNTSLYFVLPVNCSGYTAGTAYGLTINEAQVYNLKNTNIPGDMTGALVWADKPVAVIAGNSCANVPQGVLYCDYIVEQLAPSSQWGKEFVLAPLLDRTGGDTYRFLSSNNNADIYVNGTKVSTLNTGQYYEDIISSPAYVTSNGRIMVTQFSNSADFDGNTIGDPFMSTVMPVEQWSNSYTVYSPVSGFTFNAINIVAPDSALSSFYLDGLQVPGVSFTAVGASGYSYLQATVTTGTHTMAADYDFFATVYGYNWRESYGYPAGGMAFDFVHTPTATVTITVTATITRTFFTTKTVTPTMTRTITVTATETVTQTVSQTVTQTQTVSQLSQTVTPTVTVSATMTVSATITNTITVTRTQSITATVTRTLTPSVTLTVTKTNTPAPTLTITPAISATITPTMTATPDALVLKTVLSFPNPFKDSVEIVYWISVAADINLKIYTVSGEVVVEKAGLKAYPGNNSFHWDGKNRSGRNAASGVFIYRIEAITATNEKAVVMGKVAAVK